MKLFLFFVLPTVIILIAAFVGVDYWVFRTPKIKISAGASRRDKIAAIGVWFDALELRNKFNGTILFAKNGSIVFHRNMGQADALGERGIGERTSFNLASVSKHMTAFSVLLLERDCKLSRDDSITRHLPELAGHENVTLNHLLYHCSGLPDYATSGKFSRRLKKTQELLTPEMLISWLRENEAHFAPGERDEYSNTNYVLLAEITARVSQLSFADFMRIRIFEPLGMNDTAVVNKIINTTYLDDRAFGFRMKYSYFGTAIPYDLNHFDGAAGDGNIYASARDLVKWDAALRAGALLPIDDYAQAYAPFKLNNGEISEAKISGDVMHFGLGWVVHAPTVRAYGGWQGFSNAYWRNLENESVLVVLSNSGFFLRTASIGDKLIEIVADL